MNLKRRIVGIVSFVLLLLGLLLGTPSQRVYADDQPTPTPTCAPNDPACPGTNGGGGGGHTGEGT